MALMGGFIHVHLNAAAGVRKTPSSPAGPPAGILKAGWLRRHRTQRPAVAAVLVERDAGARPEAGCVCLLFAHSGTQLMALPSRLSQAAATVHASCPLAGCCPWCADGSPFQRPHACSGGRPLGLGLAGVPAGRHQGGSQVSCPPQQPRVPCWQRTPAHVQPRSGPQAWLTQGPSPHSFFCRSRGARIVVVVAVSPGAPEVPEDRMAMLCRQAGTDRRQGCGRLGLGPFEGARQPLSCPLSVAVLRGIAPTCRGSFEAAGAATLRPLCLPSCPPTPTPHPPSPGVC